jgi:hypothetical protein
MSLFRWKKGEHENWIKKINKFNRKVQVIIELNHAERRIIQ